MPSLLNQIHCNGRNNNDNNNNNNKWALVALISEVKLH